MNCIFLRRGYASAPTIDYSETFADNDWATIANVCAAGIVPETWAVGDSKTMTISGVDYITEYQVDIIGKNHDSYADGNGTAPFTFQLHDLYGIKYAMSASPATTVGGWRDCYMRSTNLPLILSCMPAEIQAAIKKVNKISNAGNGSTELVTTADKLFLLSESEVFGTVELSGVEQGAQYEYYANGATVAKNFTSSSGSVRGAYWWLRSQYVDYPNYFNYVHPTALVCSGSTATGKQGIAFAFCLGNKVGGGSSGGGTAPTEYTIAVTGTGNSNYVYVTINGTKVTSAGSYTISPGDSISCYCKPVNTFSSGTITLNGTTVATAAYNSAAEYTFAPSGDCSIALTYSGSAACSIAITTS